MGKARIISHIGEGQYSIEILYDMRRIDAEKNRLEKRIAALEKALEDAEEERKPFVKLQIAQLKKRLEILRDIPETSTGKAWCADLTEDLSGTVGTAEIARDEYQWLNIMPGYGDDNPAVYNQGRDGQLQNVLGSTAFQSYLNLCLFPAAQLHAPRYRIGEITSLSGDTCNVRLDSVSSRIRQISVNKKITLKGVPITYMNCDGDAFQAGDRVLVKFEGGWDYPRVIGFETQPQPCAGPCYIVGEISSITGDINVTRYTGGVVPSIDQRIYITDTSRNMTGLRCIQSDFVGWQVGDQVLAMHIQNCEAGPHCIESEYVRQAGILFGLINQLRSDIGVGPVYLNRRLNEAALVQAQWMADELYIGHDGPGGSTAEERILDDAEYAVRSNNNWVIGENTGFGIDAEQMFQSWMNSPGHYSNMIKEDYEEVGLASVFITRSGPVTHYSLGTLPAIQANTQFAWVNTFGWVDPPYWQITPIDRISTDG